MELDDFKNTWEQHTQKLDKQLKLNRMILQNMNFDKSKRELDKPLITEVVSVVTGVGVIIYFIAAANRLMDEPLFCILSIVAAALGVIATSISIYKIRKFLAVDFSPLSSVIETQKQISSVHHLILRTRRYELMLIPPLLLTVFPVIQKTVLGIDIFKNINGAIFPLISGTVVSYLIVYVLNKFLYDRKFEKIKTYLNEISEFEKVE